MRTRKALLSLALAACTAPNGDHGSGPQGPPGPSDPLEPLGGLRTPAPPLEAPLAPIQEDALEAGALWRSYQDVDVTVSVPPGGRLRFELWSDGSAPEDAGNALPVTVAADGHVSFELRLGKRRVDMGSVQVPLEAGDRRLRFRLRRQPGGSVVLGIDRRSGGAWVAHDRSFGVDHTALYQGRRTPVIEPAGAAISVDPLPPEAPFSWNRAFDRMADWKLYQRGPRGTADLPLSFAYRSPSPAVLVIELLHGGAPVLTRSFALPPSPGRSARAVLGGVPAGGNYQLRGRVLSGDGVLLGEDTVREIAVGDVFLAIGQSNMSGFAPLDPPEEPVPEVHLFGNDYRWKQAREPMDSGDDQVDRVSEEFPSHGILLSFAKTVARTAGVPVAVIPGPRYGTNIDPDWRRREARPLDRGSLYGSAMHRALLQGYGAPLRGVLWYQGEGNAGSGVENYLQGLARHVADLRGDLGGQVFLGNCQLSTLGTNRSEQDIYYFLQVQEAQRRYALRDKDSAVVALIDLPRDDPWHLNNHGVKEAGRRLARAVLAGSYGIPQALGPQLVGAALAAGRRDVIELSYDKGLRGGDARLMRARDDGGALPVSAVTTDGARVRVQLGREVRGQALLSYGYSSDPAAPWLVATDGSGAALVFQDLPIVQADR